MYISAENSHNRLIYIEAKVSDISVVFRTYSVHWDGPRFGKRVFVMRSGLSGFLVGIEGKL